MLILSWGTDILLEKLRPETEGWIWKQPLHYASLRGDLIQSLSSFLISSWWSTRWCLDYRATLSLLNYSSHSLLEKVQFKKCSLVCRWRPNLESYFGLGAMEQTSGRRKLCMLPCHIITVTCIFIIITLVNVFSLLLPLLFILVLTIIYI